MSRTHDVAVAKRLKIMDQLEDKYSKRAIEEFFGIVIKEVDKNKYLYNLYKDGELVFAKIDLWGIKEIFRSVASRFVSRMCDEAEREENFEETERKANELEEMEKKNEKENYYECPICHAFVRRETHLH